MNDIVIIPLGTVSPYPKGNRNNPGFLIKYKDKNILLDCGSGVTRLLNFPDDLHNLYVVITHYHLDHFSDIGALQYASYCYHNLGIIDEPIKILLPKEDYNGYKKAIKSTKENFSIYSDISNNESLYIDDLKLTFSDNHSHAINSYMANIENPNAKVVYTSDIGTTNFEHLVEFCQEADLLICESSLLKSHNLNSTTHFTAEDAATLAKTSNSKKLLLTHLWPEEDRQLYLNEATNIFENTELATEGKKYVYRRNNYD